MPSKSTNKSEENNKKTSVAVKPAPPIPPPNWPPLRPLCPTSDLTLETLLTDQIVVICNLFTQSLCKQLVSFLSDLPLATTPANPKDGDALRVNDRIQFDDAAFAERLWGSTGLKTLVTSNPDENPTPNHHDSEQLKAMWGGEVLGLNPRIRVYRYREGQFFAQHYDESNLLSFPSTPVQTAKTTWTLLIYLTGPTTGCVGGETVFYPERQELLLLRQVE